MDDPRVLAAIAGLVAFYGAVKAIVDAAETYEKAVALAKRTKASIAKVSHAFLVMLGLRKPNPDDDGDDDPPRGKTGPRYVPKATVGRAPDTAGMACA